MIVVAQTSLLERARSTLGLDAEWERPRPEISWRDGHLALVVGFVGVLALELMRSVGALESVSAPAWVQAVAVASGALLLVGRRRWPLWVAVGSAIHLFIVGATMPPVSGQIALQLVYFVALWSAVAWAPDRRATALVVGGIVLFMFAWLAWIFAWGSGIQETFGTDELPDEGLFPAIPASIALVFLINVVFFGGAILAGQLTWNSARQRAVLDAQSRTIQTQSQDLQRRAVVGERLRIARELHDVVAHHVSVIGVQAAAARRVLRPDPEAAETALAEIEGSAREAVAQMRGLLGALRDNDRGPAAEGGGHTPDRAPAPSLADLPRLAEAHATALLRVDFDLVEEPASSAATVPASVAHSVYRTAQEALVNVTRHSTADRALVVVRVDRVAPGAFAEVEVTDNGRPRIGTSGSGLGQLGIRERVASHRGQIEIGPRLTGGYRVRARFPLADVETG